MHKVSCQVPGKISCCIYAPTHSSKYKETLGYIADAQVACVFCCSAAQPPNTCIYLYGISWG